MNAVVKVYKNKVWIESDILGDKHVMIQSESPGSVPFTYCTFFYDYAYTDNSTIYNAAAAMAVSMGATQPVENRFREGFPKQTQPDPCAFDACPRK